MKKPLVFALLAACVACGRASAPALEAAPAQPGEPIEFAYGTTEGTELGSLATRGRGTAILFITTYDLASQLVARRLDDVLRRHVPRANAGAVVLEAPQYAVMADTFRTSLELRYPVAMADQATLGGGGPFGKIDRIPTLVILDAEGREVWRRSGVQTEKENRAGSCARLASGYCSRPVTFRRLDELPAWRAMAVHAWDAPRDPTVYGIIDVDATKALAYVERLRSESGVKVTLTHLVGKALAMAIAERPEVNAIIRRGRIYVRDSVDLFFQVAFEGGENLAGCKISHVDQKSVVELASELGRYAERIRAKKDHPTQQTARMLAKLPPVVAKAAMQLGERLTYDYGLNLSKLGIPYDAFGSAMVTSVSGFGLTVGQAPLFPPSRTPVILTVGAVRDVPMAVEGQVVVRPVLTIGASFDHRVADGYQAGRMAKRFREVLEEPDKELK